jgi:hypothetical protein
MDNCLNGGKCFLEMTNMVLYTKCSCQKGYEGNKCEKNKGNLLYAYLDIK